MTEVTAFIQKLEEKYGFSTEDFFADASLKTRVTEDDAFQWEAFSDHRRELTRIEEEVRREYLSKVTSPQGSKSPSPEDQIRLAA